ncbi:ribose-phosphate diphosphokinase [Methanobrevibacter sp. DSM 116169]|uniref:ribose-phosphate diphosphokinase n=1 Tax=Methanobrevibacter sp. DSM 116169 TaxID=3242727 RepID=UPI0038FCC48F
MIIAGSASQNLGAKVAKLLNKKFASVDTWKFPDGERYTRIKDEIPDEVVIIQSTYYPQDENLMELLFLISTAKDLGASKITVVTPYMGYARQEKRFNDGESISAKTVANLLEAAGATEFITLNIHEESVLDFFNIEAKNLSAMAPIAKHISTIVEDEPIIIAPDKGAFPFAEEIAKLLDCTCTYLSKVRLGPDKVETRIVDLRCDLSEDDLKKHSNVNIDSVKGKEAIIIDDIIATGGTIINAINILKEQGAKNVNVSCVHPILVKGATIRIYAAGCESIISTDTISSDTSLVSVAELIADALK